MGIREQVMGSLGHFGRRSSKKIIDSARYQVREENL